MSHKKLAIPAALVFSVAMAAGAQSQQVAPAAPAPAAAPSASPSAAETNPQPPHKILVSAKDIEWIILAEETEAFMKKSRENFVNKDTNSAAKELRIVAAYVTALGRRATGDAQQELEASARNLEQLATEVQKGAVSSPKSFDNAFAQAQQTLASYFQQKASKALAANEPKEAGDFLGAAATHFKHAAAWSGNDLQGDSASLLDNARHLAGKLIEGTGFSSQEASKTISDLGSQVKQLGQAIQPNRSQPAAK